MCQKVLTVWVKVYRSVALWGNNVAVPTVNENGTERDNRADLLQFALPAWRGFEAARADSGEVATGQTGHGVDLGSLAQGEGRSVP